MTYAKTSTGLIYCTTFPGVAIPAEFDEEEGDLNTGNLLPGEDCSFEGGTVGNWLVGANCNIANDNANGYHCTHSLEMTATAANCFTVISTTALTAAGSEYTAAAMVKGVVGKLARVGFYDNVNGWVYGSDITLDGTWQLVIATKTYDAASFHATLSNVQSLMTAAHITVPVWMKEAGLAHGGGPVLHGGGPVPSFQHGGEMKSNERVAIVERGEYIMQGSAVSKYGLALMDSLNEGRVGTGAGASGATYNINLYGDNVFPGIRSGRDYESWANEQTRRAVQEARVKP